ncbi:hypothetical protein NPIL_604371 [Nephila pilipes]|uniref:Uncharacterized protein n=1 Tax=Nephila pilipes TaxID=299642 RepID=A0A8X6JWB6_NEPPI|nr:hypothetical protein NPIL_604371 [Nephila pilipes]
MNVPIWETKEFDDRLIEWLNSDELDKYLKMSPEANELKSSSENSSVENEPIWETKEFEDDFMECPTSDKLDTNIDQIKEINERKYLKGGVDEKQADSSVDNTESNVLI